MKLLVIDSTAIISFFGNAFEGANLSISSKTIQLLEMGFRQLKFNIAIPSIVFIEIFKKWFNNEEQKQRIYYEVYSFLKDLPNVEIKSIDQEVLENFIYIKSLETNIKLENHDRIVLASALMLDCPLVTSDSKLIDLVSKHKNLPRILA